MSLVWTMTDLSQSETLVALAIADHADDEGVCWPSVDRIAEKARLKRRATQNVIKKLEQRGLLVVDRSCATGRGKMSRYQFNLKGASDAPIEKGASGRQEGCRLTTKKGAAANAPESSITIIEPSNAREPPDWPAVLNLNLEAWQVWIDHRRACGRPKYRTMQEAAALARYPPEIQHAAVRLSMDKGWQGLFPEKVNGTNTRDSKASSRFDESTERLSRWAST